MDDVDHSQCTALTRDFYEALASGDRQRLTQLLHPQFVGTRPKDCRSGWAEITAARMKCAATSGEDREEL